MNTTNQSNNNVQVQIDDSTYATVKATNGVALAIIGDGDIVMDLIDVKRLYDAMVDMSKQAKGL